MNLTLSMANFHSPKLGSAIIPLTTVKHTKKGGLLKIEQTPPIPMNKMDKRHDNVMADIRKMLDELDIYAPDFSGTFITQLNLDVSKFGGIYTAKFRCPNFSGHLFGQHEP